MIRFSNGCAFEYFAASGALGFDGQGWWWERPLQVLGVFDPSLFCPISKTLTRYPQKGNLRWWNPFRVIRLIPDGVVNAVGLTNPGIEWWVQRFGRRHNRPIIVSIASDQKEIREMLNLLNPYRLIGIEINVSCPNTGSGYPSRDSIINICRVAKSYCSHPLLLKISASTDLGIFQEISGIEAISINAVPWELYSNQRSPLKRFGGGGVSGKVSQEINWNLVREIKKLTNIPVIAPGVWEAGDIAKLQDLGAAAISFGSIFLRYPWRPTLIVRQLSSSKS